MSLRTLADIEAEYTAVRAAYLRALKQQNYSTSSGAGSRSITRVDAGTLMAHLKALSREHAQLGGGGIKIVGAVPND